jgi:LPS-assembly protein
MVCFRAAVAVLATALLFPAAAHAQTPDASPAAPTGKAAGSRDDSLPVFIDADRIEGTAGQESNAEGNAILRRGSTTIRADSLKYRLETDDVEASGNVRLERDGNSISGPALRYRAKDATGVFAKPEYSLVPRSSFGLQPVPARGRADEIEFLGEGKYRVRDGDFTTCKPGHEDWVLNARELDLDYTREVATARDATLVFKGATILWLPGFDFSLNNRRKSGVLPPSFGTTGKSGPEVSVPYYFNLAPNYDLTMTPRYMEKRGLQLAEDFRYLGRYYAGEFKAEVLPDDQAANRTRSSLSLVSSFARDAYSGGVNLNKVSDDNYFRDLGTRINVTSQIIIPREAYLGYGGSWWESGAYSATVRVQRFQVLQDPNSPIVPPYSRTPQLSFSALRQDIRGVDFVSSAEFVDFSHPTLINGQRTTIYPSLSLPLVAPGAFFTPKLGEHMTYYSLDQTSPDAPQSITRTLPIISVDSGLIFDRASQLYGQSLTQTLEPRAYYLRIPFRDQNQIPLFDTGIAEFNYAQIFSENRFAGGDRINDANQLTLAVTSRLLVPSSGQQVIRATVGRISYFEDQQVTLNPTDAPRTNRSSDWLGEVSGRVAPHWTLDSAIQYNHQQNITERFTLSTRYQPQALKTVNLSYRFLSSDITQSTQIKQVDLSSQWPIGAGWFAVGRFNYSLPERRVIEGLAGLEYGADCWVGRVVAQRFALAAGVSTTALFFQIELNGFSSIGSNPLEALKRNIPGYRRLNSQAPDPNSGQPFDFYN